jgi:hypothetical protein
VGMFSVQVTRRVPDLSKDMMFVPLFESVLFVDKEPEPDVGGHIAWVALENSRTRPLCCEGTICSCQICHRQPRQFSRHTTRT